MIAHLARAGDCRAAGFRYGLCRCHEDWDIVSKIGPASGGPAEHPLIYVAKGTHGLYYQPGQQTVMSPDPEDVAAQTCGLFETWEASDAFYAEHRNPDDDILLAKLVVGALIGVVNFIIGSILAFIEMFGHTGHGLLPPETPLPQVDEAPASGAAGTVIHSSDVNPPDAGSTVKIAWPATDALLNILVGARTYSLMVHEGIPFNPFARPPWLRTPGFDNQGFTGRWGNRVTEDLSDRRAGMFFPNFAAASLFAFARMKSTGHVSSPL
jgi:hypothetical protein